MEEIAEAAGFEGDMGNVFGVACEDADTFAFGLEGCE